MIDPLVAGLSDPDPEQRRKAVFGVLSHRRHDLLPALYELALRERAGDLAVLATQAALTLRASPPDSQQERLIEKALAEKNGHNRLGPASWEYLVVSGTRSQRLHLLAALTQGGKPPRQVWNFIESCMGHCDPDVRTAACRPAVATGYGRLLAWVLAAIEDPDAGVGREAFAAVEQAPRPLLVEALEEAVDDSEEWVPGTVAPFLPILADEDMRDLLKRGRENPLPAIVDRSREALGRLDARKLASRHLPPPPPIRQAQTPPPNVIQLIVPVASHPHPRPSIPPVPAGPLPWANLVEPPPPPPPLPFPRTPAIGSGGTTSGAPRSEPAAESVTPVVRPDEPSAAVTPAPQGSDLSIGGTPIMPAAGKGTVKKERVISMRGKISGDEAASKPAASPALSPEDQAAMFFGGTRPPPAVAIGGLTGNTPPAAPSETTPVAEKIVAEPKSGTIAKTMENASEPPVKPPELARIEPAASWESVPLDLAAAASETLPGPTLMPTPPAVDQVPGQLQPTTEPRLAVNLPPG
ncbi:MAG TPA: hypothetical protein PKM25_16415, partial [Candidatus Ozemobacteraceae bacterium]|nr:hypothetical protein [Candidatus Ozemobacteraceae bacterium]